MNADVLSISVFLSSLLNSIVDLVSLCDNISNLVKISKSSTFFVWIPNFKPFASNFMKLKNLRLTKMLILRSATWTTLLSSSSLKMTLNQYSTFLTPFTKILNSPQKRRKMTKSLFLIFWWLETTPQNNLISYP